MTAKTNHGEFFMELPLVSDFLTTVRLATGGICAAIGFDLDYTEDVKVCVTEALLILKRNGYARARIVFSFMENGKLKCSLFAVGEKIDANAEEYESADDEISFALLSALVEESDVRREGNAVCAITFFA